jgi:glycosyltransferase involved in cell wall biosynthesis
MSKILFYYSGNKRSISLETLYLSLQEKGYEVLFLSTAPKDDLHLEFERNNVKSFSNVVVTHNKLLYYFKQFIFLISFCRKHKIDFVHSHIQHVNIITVFAQFFIKGKCTIFRHHCNFYIKGVNKQDRTEKLFDKIIHHLAKKIILPSNGVRNEIQQSETKNLDKYIVLPYIYDFDKYGKPDETLVSEIKIKFNAKLRLLFCSRFVELKRPLLALSVVKKLVSQGLDVKLLVLDDGPMKYEIEKYIFENNLVSHVFILGFRKDYINYFKACDILVHPSLTDASNSTVKEMGLLEKVVIVCDDTGDFNEYIVNKLNGFLVSKENTENEMIDTINLLYENKDLISETGTKLRTEVIRKFSNSTEIIERYIKETL